MRAHKAVVRKQKASSAFTLVELMVVVSIIALLISILLPSLRNARRLAKQAACASNIRAVSLAGLTYATDDPQENAIPVSVTAAHYSTNRYSYYAYGGKAGIGGTQASGDLYSVWGDTTKMGPAHRPLNSVIYKTTFVRPPAGLANQCYRPNTQMDLEVYHCPADKGFPGFHHYGWKERRISSYDYYGTSYACNPLWVCDPSDDKYMKSNSMYLRPLSRVPNPARTVMFWENAARYSIFADNTEEYGPPGSTPPGQPPTGCRPYYDTDFVARGHHGVPWRFNVAFGDGHASWIKIKSYAIALGNQVPPDCASGGSPSARCICVLVRGNGWQLDTMPAPAIDSTHSATGFSTQVPDNTDADSELTVVP